ncbi:MAG: glycoside hydrolase family 20 zincin-like fold domain-containing protein [Trueperaceae bacterium]
MKNIIRRGHRNVFTRFYTFLIIVFLVMFANAQERLPDAYLPIISDTRIVPQPQEETELTQGYTFTEATMIYLLTDTPALRHAVELLQDDIQVRYGFRPPVEIGKTGTGIVIGQNSDDVGTSLEPVTEAEGYTLESSPAGITIIGSDERGAFYGLQSLRQILGEDPKVRGVQVRDYPDHTLRMAMIYLDKDSDINEKLIPILAQHKINTVLVMSNYIQWDSAPRLHVPAGASKEQARQLVELARLHLIEPIPLLETLGHTEWLFANNQNRDLLQDPSVPKPWVYDPLNPRTYNVLLPIFDELIELFDPTYVHIGHDEVRNVHPFPSSPEGLQIGFGKLFLQDVQKLHAHLQSRNVKTMIWQDELLSAEVEPLLSQFPKDLVVTSWNYYPASHYPDLTTLQQAGFEVIGSSWKDPDNIEAYVKDTKDKNTLGVLLTRWTGYFGNAEVIHGQYDQIYSYLIAANQFWNADAQRLEAAPDRFRTLWLGSEATRQRAGMTIDLSSVGNVDLSQGFVGLSDEYGFEGILETQRFSRTLFSINKAIALRGTHRRTKEYPISVDIPINKTAGSLAFLHTTLWSTSTGTDLGSYIVHYTDGTTEQITLFYGANISTWTDTKVSSINLLQGWSGKTMNGLPVAINTFFWTNPKPTVNIEKIEFVSKQGLASPVLLGLTVLE